MSRHDLQPKADKPDVVRATIGWDRPLQTFFAQVWTCNGFVPVTYLIMPPWLRTRAG